MAGAAAVGALLGLSTKLVSNAIRKVPYMREPWEHVALMGLGAGAASWVVNKHEQNKKEVQEILEYMDRPQMERK